MQVTVPRPDVKGRTEILNWYLSKIKVDPGGWDAHTTELGHRANVLVRRRTPGAGPGSVLRGAHCVCSPAAVDAEIIARGTVGFSGAELENLVNQAALKAAVDGKEMVTMKDLEFAKDKILMGGRTHAHTRTPVRSSG